jgi:hypothetical protein
MTAIRPLSKSLGGWLAQPCFFECSRERYRTGKEAEYSFPPRTHYNLSSARTDAGKATYHYLLEARGAVGRRPVRVNSAWRLVGQLAQDCPQ